MSEKDKVTKTAKATEESDSKVGVSAQTASAKKTKVAKPAKVSNVKEALVKQKKTNVTKAEKSAKPTKPVNPKMIRDSFTLPEFDYAKLGSLKSKCLENGVEIKKSELVRAGLTVLSKMSVATLLKAVNEVERLKTGRPKVD